MVFIDESGFIASVMQGLGVNITGSEYLSYLIVFILLFAIMLMFRVPIVFALLFMTPLVLVLMAYKPEFNGLGAVFLISLGLIVAYNWFFKPS